MAKTATKTNKITIAIVSIVVALILAAATIVMGYITRDDAGNWFHNNDLATWGWNKSDKEEGTEKMSWGGAIDNVGNELNSKTTYAMPGGMAFYAAYTDELANKLDLSAPSVTVTCSHNFEFNNVFVDWSVEYPSGTSAADVLTVTPTSDGSLTATVTCLKGFDQQLILKATLRGNSEKTATCKIDYVKRIERINSISMGATDFGDNTGIGVTSTLGAGTITGTQRASVTYKILDGFQTEVRKYLKFDISFKSYSESDVNLVEYSIKGQPYYSYDGEVWAYSMFIEGFDTYDEAHQNAIYYAWRAAFCNAFQYKTNVIIDADISVLYNGKVIQTVSETDYIGTGVGNGSLYLSGEVYADGIAPALSLNDGITL